MFERSNTTKTLKDYIWLKNEQFNVMGRNNSSIYRSDM